jgi:pyruvate formate lyase activating enzyme
VASSIFLSLWVISYSSSILIRYLAAVRRREVIFKRMVNLVGPAPKGSIKSTPRPEWVPAMLATRLGGKRVRCDLCPFRCDLADGRTGACKVRRNRDGALETATTAVAVRHLDAIERKPFYHVLPGSQVLTIAAPGCTFRCTYCVNHRLSQYGRDTEAVWLGVPATPADLIAQALTHGAILGMSYTEPGLAPELTLALAELAASHGIPLIWKSNGFLTPQATDLVAPCLSAVNIDVKAADDVSHRWLTGAPLSAVLDTVERFRAAGVWVEISTPMVPTTASKPTQLRTIARTLAAIGRDIPWHLLRFTPDYQFRQAIPTSPGALATAVDIGHEAGLRYVYVERALGAVGRRTSCPSCASILVDREIWALGVNKITEGACPSCEQRVPGIWG